MSLLPLLWMVVTMALSSYADPNFYLNQPSFLDYVTGNPWSQQQYYNVLQQPQLPGMTTQPTTPTAQPAGNSMLPNGMPNPFAAPTQSTSGSSNVVPMSDWIFFNSIPGFSSKFMNPQQAQQATMASSGSSLGTPLASGSNSGPWPSGNGPDPRWNPADPDPVHQAQWGPQGQATFASGTLPSTIDPGVAKWKDLIERVSKEVGVKASQIAGLMQIETHGNNEVSGSGAQGLMQVMPFNAGGANLMDPYQNIKRGAQLFKERLDRFGQDQTKAAASYFGAADAQGNPTMASDGGTNGVRYAQLFNNAQRQNQPFDNLIQQVSNYVPQIGQALESARQFVGKPYVWGGRDPQTGFDCSGLTQWVYGQHGINLPRTAQLQYNVSQKIDKSQTLPGDLIFFQGTYPTSDQVTHVGLYVGNGMMLSASQNGIGYQSLTDPFWASHFAGVGRVH